MTLNKSATGYSPATLYDDFALSNTIFHWQSQNASRADKGRGLSYVKQQKKQKIILLFVREQNDDQFKNTMAYVFLGEASYLNHQGTKPMNI